MATGSLIRLTEQQKVAVEHQGNVLLTACPGSGKTRTLIAKLVAEIEGVRGSPKAISCITYTNTAVEEIEKRAREQLLPGDDAYFNVSTIHAFCLNEIVRPYGWMKPEFSGSRKILTRESPDFEAICIYAAEQVNLYTLRQSDYEAFEGLSVDAAGQLVGLAARNEVIKRAAPHFWRRCTELGYIDFGTIIYAAYCILRDEPRVARTLCARFRWFLIDEFQDTTELQIEVLKLLHATGRSSFFVVGDVAQSIYAFAGARPELVAPFGRHIGARLDFSLWENFRSSKLIVEQAERLFPRRPEMVAAGEDRNYPSPPTLITGLSIFQAITEEFLPRLTAEKIELGDATILAKDWGSLIGLARQLRQFGTPIVGPGARPYKRSRLFANLAEQLCGALTDASPETSHQLEKALYFAIADATGQRPTNVFSHAGRVVLIRLMRQASSLAAWTHNAMQWLDAMSHATGAILLQTGYVDEIQSGLFFASAQEMKADMRRQDVDTANLSISDLGLFASPNKALRLSTLHFSKGREYDAVAMIGLRAGWFPHRNSDDVEAEKRLFYVGVTRARKMLMYVCERDSRGDAPSVFLGRDGVGMV